MNRAAVIATHNRPIELRRCVEAIAAQVDQLVIVDNASDPPVDYRDLMPVVDPRTCVVTLMHDREQPPNLSRLWNMGLDYAKGVYTALFQVLGTPLLWDVAVLNDDATVPPDWFANLAGIMRQWDCYAASHNPFEPVTRAHGPDAPMSVTTRLAGWAMVLRGEWSGARFDESMRWWCADDDMSLRAREAGGLMLVAGVDVPNEHADRSTTGVLAEQTAIDMQTFVDKHGRRPW